MTIPGLPSRRLARSSPLLLILLVLTMLAACGEPDPALTQQEGPAGAEPQGEILFVSENNVMRWDGNIEQVTKDVFAASPSWSPAGDRFAYIQVGDAFSDVVVADSDGDPLVKVTEGHQPDLEPFTEEYVAQAAWAWDVDWSPAGEQLIYVSDKGLTDEFSRPLYLWFSETFDVGPYLLNASADIGTTQEDPSFSPEGNQVAFVVRNDPGDGNRVPEIWTMDLNAATFNPFVVAENGAYDPDWSPDGTSLAYIQRTGQANDVWIAPLNGDDPYQITDIGSCVSPVWSPDGKFIAFFRENQGEFETWYVEVSQDDLGRIAASEPKELFSASNIDTPSGMSWILR